MGLSRVGHDLVTDQQQFINMSLTIKFDMDFPGGLVVKNTPANAGDRSPIPGLGSFHMPRSN